MKSYDYDAVTFDGEVFCCGCLPDGLTVNSADVMPVFADSEWDGYPVCANCGEVHDYVSLTPDGCLYECGRRYIEVFHHDGVRYSDDDCWVDDDGNPLPAGWYYWTCFSGCIPEGDPIGPFDTANLAAIDAIYG